MAFEAPVENYKSGGGYNGPDAGKYHVKIIAVDEDGGDKGEMIAEYEVLSGTTPNQEGKIFHDKFHKTIKAMGRFHNLAIACGMTTDAQLKELKAQGKSPTYDFNKDALGKQICVDLEPDEYNGVVRAKCGFGIFHLTDKRCATWPKNAGMLKSAGIVLPEQPVAGGSGASPAMDNRGGNKAGTEITDDLLADVL